DQGQVTIPNGQLPTAKGNHNVVVTEPNKASSAPVSVEIPGKKETAEATPETKEVKTNQNPTTGDVTLTPTTENGKTYPEGSTATVKGSDGGDKTYTVDNKGKEKNSINQLPKTNEENVHILSIGGILTVLLSFLGLSLNKKKNKND
ncbi:TPA: LPXTG cell wall anchor domain-containing protein, partial [Enterococcus faecium]